MNPRFRRSRGAEEEESYFISMADMMVGLVFVFIILLIYFALQYQQKSKALSDAGEARSQMLLDIRDDIKRRNPALKVIVNEKTGVLHLPAEILFAKGDTELSAGGTQAVVTVAQSMAAVLPCYTYPRRTRNCRPTTHGVDAIFIEGHTDSDPLQGSWIIKGNLELSALRATNTFRTMIQNVAELDKLGSEAVSLAAGDGANDLPMLEAATYGIAYRAKPLARKAADGWIDRGDLTSVLRLLGIP